MAFWVIIFSGQNSSVSCRELEGFCKIKRVKQTLFFSFIFFMDWPACYAGKNVSSLSMWYILIGILIWRPDMSISIYIFLETEVHDKVCYILEHKKARKMSNWTNKHNLYFSRRKLFIVNSIYSDRGLGAAWLRLAIIKEMQSVELENFSRTETVAEIGTWVSERVQNNVVHDRVVVMWW